MPISLLSTGRYLPPFTVGNEAFTQFLDTSDEWIVSRTGIHQRHIAQEETTTDLATRAAAQALERSGLAPEEIGLVVCATVTPDTSVPMVAANVKRGLGIERAAAFDVNANCSSFLYALAAARGMMETCGFANAIVVGADCNSQLIDWSDRSTCVLFGDGAGAVVLHRGEEAGLLSCYVDCVTDTDHVLTCHHPRKDTPFCKAGAPHNTDLYMKGSAVMRFAVKALAKAVRAAAAEAGVAVEDIAYFVPHQANLRIIQSASKLMKIPMEKFVVDIDHVANTSSGSVPVALDILNCSGQLKKGDRVCLVAFGGGLSSAASVIRV